MSYKLSPQFMSFQGLRQIITSRSSLQEELKGYLHWIKSHPAELKAKSNYKRIRLLDTFFSDTIGDDVLDEIILFTKNNNFTIQLLLLDPFSKLAQSRAKALDHINPIEEINKSLINIINSINTANDNQPKLYKNNSLNNKSSEGIFSKLEQIENLKKDISIDIRFYSVLTESPVYIISQFLAKGLIIHAVSAAKNPWLVFVDNPFQNDDIYDCLSANFTRVWNDSRKEPNVNPELPLLNEEISNNIFISHGHNEFLTLKIRNFFKEKLSLNPILFEENAEVGLTIVENLEKTTSECSKALILLTKEDETKDGGVRARQNVVHELGFCQAKYGRENVLLLIENGTELPSNIDGIIRIQFTADTFEACYEEIRQKFS